MLVRTVAMRLWAGLWLAGVSVVPSGAATMTPLDTLTIHDLAAEVAAFDAAHKGVPHTEMPRYREIAARMQMTVPDAGAREVAAALDDTLIEGASRPDALVLDLLSHHRIAGDHWRG